MSAQGTRRGHAIRWDEDAEVFRYEDTGQPVPENPSRDCAFCGAEASSDEPDPCLGMLPGVANACCGHGDPDESYIQFENGVIVRGFDRIDPREG